MEKILSVIGYSLIGVCILLLFGALYFDIFENARDYKYFFLIGSFGSFILAYSNKLLNKKMEKNYMYDNFILLHGISVYVLMGLVSLLLVFII